MNGMRLRFQKGDVTVIAGIVLLALLVFFAFLPPKDAPAAYAEIYQEGRLLKTVLLSQDQEFTVTGKYTNTVTVCNGKIAVTHSDCPGGDCVSCGWADGVGRSIVCLPNALEIRVMAGSGDVDFVVG